MRTTIAVGLFGFVAAENMRNDDRCPHYNLGTVDEDNAVLTKEQYHRELLSLDIEMLYNDIVKLMTTSESCWPADGPQDGDVASYAGLFERLAWHCSGSFRLVNGTDFAHAAGGCEGARQRFWPENEWRDNTNLDKARSILAKVKAQYGTQISWSDLITFAGTVGIKASGGPAKKFCFGRVDDVDGSKSVPLGVEGVNSCTNCSTDKPCKEHFWWPEQNQTDNFRCELEQLNGRQQASHSVGLIYVYPEGPQLKNTEPDYNPKWVHNRSPRLSAKEVRQTFKERMGWTDRETVVLIGGGHTLGRTHGNCDLKGSQYEHYNEIGPHFEAIPGSGRGPTDGTCGWGREAGLGPNTVSSGFEGPWTRTPSKWNYDFFEAMFAETWEPVKSPLGNDQWATSNRASKYAHTRRLTADVSLMADEVYRPIAQEYASNPETFDSDFADAWYKLVHRSAAHPHGDDLEKDAGLCTQFEFVPAEVPNKVQKVMV